MPAQSHFQLLDKARLLQLQRIHVDADWNVETGFAPSLHVRQRVSDYPVAQLDDEQIARHHRQETLRREYAKLRMPPANQRFGAEDRACRHIDPRLKEQLEFMRSHCLPNALQIFVAAAHAAIERRVEHVMPRSPGEL